MMYMFVAGGQSEMNLLWTNGSHLLIHVGSDSGISMWKYVTLKNESIGGMAIKHVFPNVGVFRVCLNASNEISKESACTNVNVEIPLHNFSASVICKKRFKNELKSSMINHK